MVDAYNLDRFVQGSLDLLLSVLQCAIALLTLSLLGPLGLPGPPLFLPRCLKDLVPPEVHGIAVALDLVLQVPVLLDLSLVQVRLIDVLLKSILDLLLCFFLRMEGMMKRDGVLTGHGHVLPHLQIFELLDDQIRVSVDIAFLSEDLDHPVDLLVGVAHLKRQELVEVLQGSQLLQFVESLRLVLLHGAIGVGCFWCLRSVVFEGDRREVVLKLVELSVQLRDFFVDPDLSLEIRSQQHVLFEGDEVQQLLIRLALPRQVLIVPGVTGSYVLVLDDPIVIFDHLLHEIDHIALLVELWLFETALLQLSQHALVLEPSDLVLNLLDLVGFADLSAKFAEGDVGNHRPRALYLFLLFELSWAWGQGVTPAVCKPTLQFLLLPALLLKRCIHCRKDYQYQAKANQDAQWIVQEL